MKNLTYLILGLSVLATVVVSAFFGLGGSLIVGSFWGWFWITLLLQLIGFVCLNSFLIKRDNASMELIQAQALDALSKFSIQITCSYCRQQNVVPIQLNQRNTFKCDSCNQINVITMQFNTAPLTTPIDSVSLPVEKNESIEFRVSA